MKSLIRRPSQEEQWVRSFQSSLDTASPGQHISFGSAFSWAPGSVVYLELKPCLKLFNKDMNFWGTSQSVLEDLQVVVYRVTATSWPHTAGQGELLCCLLCPV